MSTVLGFLLLGAWLLLQTNKQEEKKQKPKPKNSWIWIENLYKNMNMCIKSSPLISVPCICIYTNKIAITELLFPGY